MRPIDSLTSAFAGTEKARRDHAQALAQQPGIAAGVAELARLCPGDPATDTDSPIFLFSAGWRSGSTLLQRLLMSDPRVLLWGEPFDECGPIQAMAATVRAFRPGWPPPDYYLSHHAGVRPGELADDWIANLFPAPQALRAGHRAFFDAAFAAPARQAGAQRWGIKEVRLSVEHAQYLRWLYPKARFLFLYRNPLDAYVSYCRYGRSWYETWPDRPVFTPTAFGKHWHRLTAGFLLGAPSLEALVVPYEDLASHRADLLETIERDLGIAVNRAVLGNKIGSSARDGSHASVSVLERELLRRAVNPLAAELGYKW